MTLNALVIVLLVVFKASPGMIADLQERQKLSKAERIKETQRVERKRHRETRERRQDSMRRRKF